MLFSSFPWDISIPKVILSRPLTNPQAKWLNLRTTPPTTRPRRLTRTVSRSQRLTDTDLWETLTLSSEETTDTLCVVPPRLWLLLRRNKLPASIYTKYQCTLISGKSVEVNWDPNKLPWESKYLQFSTSLELALYYYHQFPLPFPSLLYFVLWYVLWYPICLDYSLVPPLSYLNVDWLGDLILIYQL